MPNEAEQEVAAPAASNRGVLQTFSRTQAKPASSGVKAAGFQGLPPSFLFSAERSVPSIVGKTRTLYPSPIVATATSRLVDAHSVRLVVLIYPVVNGGAIMCLSHK